MRRRIVLFVCGLVALATAWPVVAPAVPAAEEKADAAATERARKTVRMLDDIYKSAIVLITDKYVKTERDYPAGRAAVRWFADISKKGSHEVRIIDATGEPSAASNVARDDFDKEGIRQLKAGKSYYEQVIRKDGKTYLRAITPVPVVMAKCTMCHENYKTVKQGEPVGALTYSIAVE
jgi:hypothetical protein